MRLEGLRVQQRFPEIRELYLLDEKHLIDDRGIRYKRSKPVLKLRCRMTSRDSHVHLGYFEQQILDLQKEGKLKKGLFAANAYVVSRREYIEEKETVMRSWGPTEYTYLEECDIELHRIDK